MQNLWIWLLIAFLIGVLLEWLLEMFFFRRRWRVMIETCERNLAQAQADLKAKSADLDAALKAKADLTATLQARDKEIADLKAQLARANADLNAALGDKATLTSSLSLRDKEAGDFKLQIGKLTTDFTALTAAKVAVDASLKSRDTEIADLKARLAKAEADLKAALADKSNFSASQQSRDKETGDLKAQLAKLAAEVTAIGAAKIALDATVNSRDADLAACRKSREDLTAERDRLNKEIADLKAKLAATPATVPVPTIQRRSADDETPYEAGCPQHLSDVNGIGSVYEQRLYEAGVGSYWDLAHLSNDDIKRILQVTDLQLERMNFDEIRADSMRLAQETRTKGRKWSGGAPDDFEPMEGIGHVFEKRLYDAGICTYEALAQLTPQILDEVCESPRIKPDYQNWIKQAQKLAAKKAAQKK
jgi:predicted flap endonuclease-1-like 5' DNA nuclease